MDYKRGWYGSQSHTVSDRRGIDQAPLTTSDYSHRSQRGEPAQAGRNWDGTGGNRRKYSQYASDSYLHMIAVSPCRISTLAMMCAGKIRAGRAMPSFRVSFVDNTL